MVIKAIYKRVGFFFSAFGHFISLLVVPTINQFNFFWHIAVTGEEEGGEASCRRRNTNNISTGVIRHDNLLTMITSKAVSTTTRALKSDPAFGPGSVLVPGLRDDLSSTSCPSSFGLGLSGPRC